MVVIYTEPICRKYVSSRCSCTYCYHVLAFIALVLIPLFLAFSSHSFWLKEKGYFEQPRVKFQYKLIMLAEGSRVVNNESRAMQLFYSTNATYNNLYEASVRVPEIRSSKEDSNRDAIADAINLNIRMPLLPKEEVKQVTLLVFFKYQLKNRVRLSTEAAVFVQCQSGLPGRQVNIHGDLTLHQRELLQVQGGPAYLTQPLIATTPPFEASSAKDLLFPNIMAEYHKRNITTRLGNQYIIWEQALPEQNQNLTVKARIVIPETHIWYRPDWSEMVKWAWIQYYSLFVVVLFFFGVVNQFIYRNQILETRTITEPAGNKKLY